VSPPPVTVQVASFRTRRRAERVLAQAQAVTGLSGIVVPARVGEERWHRILLGSFSSEEAAARGVEPLLRQRLISEIVLRPVEKAWIPSLSAATP
jgi:cell division protein FtsN